MTTPRRNQVDLHTHTARSDGVLEPLELYRQMAAWGSALVAITDHDTLAGARELLAAGLGRADGDEVGPRIIVGVEINTAVDDEVRAIEGRRDDVEELHILGFGVDPDDRDFEAVLARQRDGRSRRLEQTLARLDELGLPVRDELPSVPGGIDALGRPHVARALVGAGHALSVQDAFSRFLVPGAPAYVRRDGVGPRAAIEAIESAGGIASLAHASWTPDAPAIFDTLEGWGLRGLEVYYGRWDEATVTRMTTFAHERGLLATGGSDFHGDTSDYATAQASGPVVPTEVGEQLLEALGRVGRPGPLRWGA